MPIAFVSGGLLSRSPAQPTERTLPFPPLQTFTYRQCSRRSGRWAARGRRQRYQGICRECGRLPPEPSALPRCGGSLHYVRGLSLVLRRKAGAKLAPSCKLATPEKILTREWLFSIFRHQSSFRSLNGFSPRLTCRYQPGKSKAKAGRASHVQLLLHPYQFPLIRVRVRATYLSSNER